MATIRHPVTEAVIDVPDQSLPHLRASGWQLLSEWQDDQAAKAAREAAAAKADAEAAKSAKGAAKAADKE